MYNLQRIQRAKHIRDAHNINTLSCSARFCVAQAGRVRPSNGAGAHTRREKLEEALNRGNKSFVLQHVEFLNLANIGMCGRLYYCVGAGTKRALQFCFTHRGAMPGRPTIVDLPHMKLFPNIKTPNTVICG